MKSLSILCQKGGVGKTTIVVNIAKIYSNNGIKTLIIDLDPQGNASTYLDFNKQNKSILTSQNIMEGKLENEIAFLHDNLGLIPSNEAILKFNAEKIIGGSVLAKAFESIIFKDFDIIIFDTPPTMSSLVQEAICASDFYLIPTKPEFLAIEGVSQAMSFAKETLLKQVKVNSVFLGVVLNQIDARRNSYHDFEKELEYLLADKLLNTKVSNSADVADSPYYLKTVEDFTNESKSKKEFYQLANEILERMNIDEKIIEQSYNWHKCKRI